LDVRLPVYSSITKQEIIDRSKCLELIKKKHEHIKQFDNEITFEDEDTKDFE
jgi:hypothetical protein